MDENRRTQIRFDPHLTGARPPAAQTAHNFAQGETSLPLLPPPRDEPGSDGSDNGAENPPKHLNVEEAFEACKVVRGIAGQLTDSKFTPRAQAMLPAAIAFVDAIGSDPDGCNKARTLIKTERKSVRAPNKNNIELVALQTCCLPITLNEQKGLSKFANVVKLARLEGISPNKAADWLVKRDFAEMKRALKALQDGSKANKPVTNPITKSKFPHLVEVLSNKDGPLFAQTSADIAEALTAINSRLADMKAATSAAVAEVTA